ncbi:2Fe-2S iron-sulfur cluster-binding protein [Defluviimonas salinarum]|nr:2Fe-2S iron-sulfur cluster-binding protein [Defluviimonas salinarum]
MTRLDAPFGSRIDRSRPISFSFEGQRFTGYEGDTIASALAASGQWMLSRSFKYHRPRGAFSMAGAEANTLVQVGSEPNLAADLTPLAEGMVVSAQNVNGSLARDRDAVMDRLGRFMPVGFYYRTFMGPTRKAWLKWWEPLIRAKAGLGMVDLAARPDGFDKSHLHCDILVVGAGPAGLAAAIEAAEAGADVILGDESPDLGGRLTYAPEAEVDLTALVARAEALPALRIMTGTVCNGWFEDNWLPLIRGKALHRCRAREVILATGGIEQPAVFRGNDLPGILTGGAVRRLIRHYGVRPGTRSVILAGTPDGLGAAEDLLDVGTRIAALVLPRDLPGHAERIGRLRSAGAEILTGRIEAARGGTHVEAVQVGGRWIDCDLVAVSVGHAPSWQLPCQAGARLGYDDATCRFSLDLARDGLHLAGSVAGHASTSAVIADGRRAAMAALRALDIDAGNVSPCQDLELALAHCALPLNPHPKGRDFVDFDEDLQVKDIVNAVREGYRELELVKRFSTVGMGPSQGRHSALATARIVAAATGRSVAETGVTTARPPVGPETLGALAGHGHVEERRTALHARHLEAGAEMRPVGAWWRPYLYGRGDRVERITEEVRAVREGAGLLDVSTLGKLEVRGPDAGAFLDRLYTMAHANQPVGKVRYCLMLNEMAAVIDDGVAFRMADDVFYVTATTGAVARVYADMALWNAQWRIRVDVANLTAAFSGLNITGPKARDVLQALSSDIDFSPAGFPYLEGRIGVVAGIPVRVMRIGFTGELSYELHCPSSHAPALWDAVMAAGAPLGLRPYGLEASRILRLEKGHILIGQDTDALTSPDELGFGWAVSKKKAFFVGKRALEMRRRLGESRRLVGLIFEPGTEAPGESCLVLRGGEPVGHVTSVAHSPTLGRVIALAYTHVEDAAPGTEVTIRARSGKLVTGRVAGHAFVDPENRRQEI